MTTITVTIGGTTVVYQGGTLKISESTNSRNTLEITVQSLDTSFRPAWGAEIIVTQSGTRIFGGYIEDFEETGIGGESAGPGAEYTISARDYNSVPDRRFVNTILPAGTLKSQLLLLDPLLTPYSISLDPAQATGPAMPAVALPFMSLTDALNRLCEIAMPTAGQAEVWEVDYNKLWRVFGVLDGSHAAPFSITTEALAAANIVGDIKVRPSRTDFANGILLVYGEGRREQVDTLGVGNGVTTAFALHLPLTATHGYINVGGSLVSGVITGGTNESFGYASESPIWVYDATLNTATRTSAPSVGQTILCPYEAQFPGLVTSYAPGLAPVGGIGLSTLVERLYTQTTIFDVVQAQAVADALLVKANIQLQEIEYTSHTAGLHPGQVQTVTRSKRNVSGTHIITSVDIVDEEETVLKYYVKAVSGSSALPESWAATYQLWSRGSSVASAGSVTVFTGSPARPAFFLGGNDTLYKQDPTPTWVAADAIRVTIDTSIRQSASGIVYCRLRATSGNVTARLRNITDGSTAGTSAVVSSTSWTAADFAVTLATGAKVYELQLLPSVANVDVAGVGTFI